MYKRNAFIGLALLIVAAIAAFVFWDRHETQQLQITTMSQIDGATRALRAAISPATDTQSISASAARVDQDLVALRSLGTSRIPLLAAGADGYLLSARELLRRQVVMRELHEKVGGEIIAFRDHIMTRNRGAANWTTEAVRLKNQLEQDFREYQRTIDAHTKIADGYPDARKQLATLIPDSELMATAEIAAARDAALAAAQALAAEVEAVRRLAAPR